MSDVSTNDVPRRRLGRGLSAMLGSGPAFAESESTAAELRNVPIHEISRNPFQPRKDFNPEDLNELSDSIREHGVLQPILVRELDGAYQLIAGERRWLASQRAGLTSIPCRVVDVIDQTAFDYALEENLKRKDLSDIEKALAFRQYLDHFQCSIEELGKQLSMSRSAVSNILRLLELPEPVRNALSTGKISSGHARSLLPLPEAEQLALCGQIQAEQLSVRQSEAIVRQMLGREKRVPAAEPAGQSVTDQVVQAASEQAIQPHAGAMEILPSEFAHTGSFQGDNNQGHIAPSPECQSLAPSGDHNWQTPPDDHQTHQEPQILSMDQARSDTDRTPHLASLEEQLRNLLGTQVEIRLKSKDSGTILIPFNSHEEFERLLRSLHRAAA
jgi:ParB family transcriptional regulator, chromosome partitioning protein